MKKVLINVNSLVKYTGSTHLSGTGRSTSSLLKELGRTENLPFEIILYSQRVKGGGLEDYNLPFKSFRLPFPNRIQFSKIAEWLYLREIMTAYDLYHVPNNTDYVAIPYKTVFTIHDLMIYRFPDFFPFTKRFDRWVRKLMADCKAIVTCSNSSKTDIVEYWKIPEEKITVIKWGIDRSLFHMADSLEIENIRKIFDIQRPFFLVVSCDHPRKNISLILKAFRILLTLKTDYELILVWSNPSVQILEEYNKEIINRRIHFLKNVTDEHLRALYSAATATLFTSLYEGFGFPVLESLACHTPVVTCRNSSLKEIGGDHVIYTSENDVEELIANMRKLEEGKFHISESIEKIENHLDKFSWEKTAKEYVDFYLKNLS